MSKVGEENKQGDEEIMTGAIARTEAGEAGVTEREEFGATEVVRIAETAMSAMAAQQKAMTEARFIVAMRVKRNWQDIRVALNKLCADPEFAAEALYVKPIARTPAQWDDWSKRERLQKAPEDWPRGFSIRFIEAVLFESGNFDVDTMVFWEDADKRMTRVTVIDLQKNSAYSRTVTTQKIVERRQLKKGQMPLGTRENSYGDLLYILPATDDEVNLKEAAGVSKALRTLGERLLPPHMKREWRNLIEKTIMDAAAKDPEAAKKKIVDSFATQGVIPSMLDAYLGHSIDQATPAEFAELRGIYVALAAGEANWSDVMETKQKGESDEPESTSAKSLKERIIAQQKRAAAPQAGKSAEPATQQSGEPPLAQETGVAPVGGQSIGELPEKQVENGAQQSEGEKLPKTMDEMRRELEAKKSRPRDNR